MAESVVESLLAPDVDEGRWFPWRGAAEFLVRRVPRQTLRKLEIDTYGKTAAFAGAKVEREKVDRYFTKCAIYALVDSRNVSFPRRFLAGTELGEGDGAEVLLDGKWSEAVKARVFEQIALASVIVNWASEMADVAAAEVAAGEEEKG